MNFSGPVYESGIDPAGFYGGIPPTSVHFEKGSDVLGIVIPLNDPDPTGSSTGVVWPVDVNRAPWLSRLSAAVREYQAVQKK